VKGVEILVEDPGDCRRRLIKTGGLIRTPPWSCNDLQSTQRYARYHKRDSDERHFLGQQHRDSYYSYRETE
jgi:hypothetical protein